MGMFEKFKIGGKKKELGELGKKQEVIQKEEFLKGIDASKVTIEKLQKMKEIARELEQTKNTEGKYVESEYDVKKKELAQHIKENVANPSKWVKATVLEGLAAAGLLMAGKVSDIVALSQEYGFSKVVDAIGDSPQFIESSAGVALLLTTAITAGISIMKKIKKNFETKKAMAKYISAKAEGLSDEDADAVAKSKNWYYAGKTIYKGMVDKSGYGSAEKSREADKLAKKAYKDFEDGDKIKY